MQLGKYSQLSFASLILQMLAFFQSPLQASAVTSVSELGDHYPFLKVEKNENPQNSVVVYAKLNSDCSLQGDPNQPESLFDFYWLMDGMRYKPVHPLIKSGIRKRLTLDQNTINSHSFMIELGDLSEVHHDLDDTRITIKVSKAAKGCRISATMKLGSSDHSVNIRLTSIYAESHGSFKPPYFKTLDALTLKGTELTKGRSITHRYIAR